MIEFLLPYASWPLALAFIIAYSAGMVWYHPKVFGTVWWAQQPHRDPEAELAKMRELMVISAADLFFATVLIIILFNRFAYEGFILLLLTVGLAAIQAMSPPRQPAEMDNRCWLFICAIYDHSAGADLDL